MTEAITLPTVTLPSECPHCQEELDTNDVDWISALTAKCRCCGFEVKGRLKRLRFD